MTAECITKNDKILGQRIKTARQKKRLSQTNLAAECGVSFQQIQKYESGINRVSVSRLIQIAGALRMQPETFLEGLR